MANKLTNNIFISKKKILIMFLKVIIQYDGLLTCILTIPKLNLN